MLRAWCAEQHVCLVIKCRAHARIACLGAGPSDSPCESKCWYLLWSELLPGMCLAGGCLISKDFPDADRGGFGGGFGGGGGGRARGPARQAELGTVARPGSRTNLSSSDVARMQVHAAIEQEPAECRVSLLSPCLIIPAVRLRMAFILQTFRQPHLEGQLVTCKAACLHHNFRFQN